MRPIRMLGLAVWAAVAAMTFVATASAVASDEGIGFCEANEPLLCARANQFHVPEGGSLDVLTEASNPIFQSAVSEKCERSTSTFSTTEEDKKAMNGSITAMRLSGNCIPCKKITYVGLPYSAKLTGSGIDYVLEFSFAADFTECTFGTSCKFEGEKVTLLGVNTVEGAEYKAEEEVLKQTGGNNFFCGSTGKLTANYRIVGVDLLDSTGSLIEEHKGPAWMTLLADEGIGLCKADEPVSCANENLLHVPAGGSLDVLTKASNPILRGALTEKCETSFSAFSAAEEDKGALNGKITTLTFTGSCAPCATVTSLNLPYSATLTGSGTDYVLESSFAAELTECTFGVTCKFEGEKVTLLGVNTAEGAEYKAEEEVLKQTGSNTFFCGATGKWTANYRIVGVDLLDSTGSLIEEHKGSAWLTLLELK